LNFGSILIKTDLSIKFKAQVLAALLAFSYVKLLYI